MARLNLPTLSAMRCFEVAARHMSFTRAAEELSLTQSAVSKQVAQLESLLEQPLFRRVRQRLQITPEGALYLREVRKLLSQAEISTRQMRSYSGKSEILNVATPPTFGARWMIPHLNGFRFRHPRITLNICNRTQAFDLEADEIDVAFFFGHGAWSGAECIELMHETVVPVCTPSVMGQLKITEPLALTQLVLLQTAARPEAWHDWFAAQDCYTDHSYHGPRFENFSMALRAARAGCGVALVPQFLAADELDSGQLVIPWTFSITTAEAYYLVYPENKGKVNKIEAFVNWIVEHGAVDRPICDHAKIE